MVVCRYDCGIYVYQFVQAITEGRDVLHVTPEEHNTWVVRAKLAAYLLIEGRKRKKEVGKLDDDDVEM